jgi:hypothetical protein
MLALPASMALKREKMNCHTIHGTEVMAQTTEAAKEALTYIASSAMPQEFTPIGRRMKPLSPQEVPQLFLTFQYGVDAVVS